MKEYRLMYGRWRAMDTEVMLNSFADKGWKVIGFPERNCFLLERDVKK